MTQSTVIQYSLQKAAAEIRAAKGLIDGWQTGRSSTHRLQSGREDVKTILKYGKAFSSRAIAYEAIRQERIHIQRGRSKFKPLPELQARLTSTRQKFALPFTKALRSCSNTIINFTEDPTQVTAFYTSKYDGRTSAGWVKTIHTLYINLPARWKTRVQRRGLAVVDGMLTLDAAVLETRLDGVKTYALTWVEQRRGYECEEMHGFLAQQDGVSYHGKTLALAVAGLARKRSMTPEKREQMGKNLKKGVLIKEIRAFGKNNWENLPVCVQDAKSTGACDYGIRSWCARVGIDYNATCAPLVRLVEGYVEYPLPEVRATILHVLRAA